MGYLGEFEQLILFALLRLGDDAYGGAVGKELERRTGRTVSRGALYVTIDRLENKGMLSTTLGESTPGRGGRRKRHLEVTPAGVAALRAARRNWMSLWAGLDDVLGEPS